MISNPNRVHLKTDELPNLNLQDADLTEVLAISLIESQSGTISASRSYLSRILRRPHNDSVNRVPRRES